MTSYTGAVLKFCSSYFLPRAAAPEAVVQRPTRDVTLDDAALLLLMASQNTTATPADSSLNPQEIVFNMPLESPEDCHTLDFVNQFHSCGTSMSVARQLDNRRNSGDIEGSEESFLDADSTKSDEKPYICPEDGCEGAFKRKAHLEMHIRIHTDERPFVCAHQECGKSFRSKSHLNTHQRYGFLVPLSSLLQNTSGNTTLRLLNRRLLEILQYQISSHFTFTDTYGRAPLQMQRLELPENVQLQLASRLAHENTHRRTTVPVQRLR